MRKKKKENLLELVDTLKSAVYYVYTNDNEVANTLKQDALNCIIFMKNMIQEETQLLRLCEDCYNLLSEESEDLVDTILHLEQSIICLRETFEVLFLPYKADMWDCFHSIWQAAKKDSEFKTVVMPIPYYNLDYTNGKMIEIYEGNRFPEGLDVEDYKKYNIELNHPDIIFVHNPYDENNRVTRVKESYFSYNLANYTEKLIYVPYYVHFSLKYFNSVMINLPSLHRFWRIFVQSEAIKRFYEECGVQSNKIVAIGSPKIDGIIDSDDEEIPDDWKAKINGKKVILINTHLDNIINAYSEFLKQFKEYISIFHKNKSVVWLWRPHPLSLETITAMQPKAMQQYLELIKQFKELENGIYDDSPNLKRAIKISDAYIGDYSSVVALFGVSGKPMLLLRKLAGKEKNKYLPVVTGVSYKNSFYYSTSLFNGFFRLDLNSEEITYLGRFSKEKNIEFLHRSAYCYKNKCWLTPQRGEYLTEVNLDTFEMNYIKLPDSFLRILDIKVLEHVADNQYLWLISMNGSVLLKVDMETGLMQEINGWLDNIKINKNECHLSSAVSINNHIWYQLSAIKKMVIINTYTNTFDMKDFDYPDGSYWRSVYDGKNIWFAPYNCNQVLKYNPVTNEMKQIQLPIDGLNQRLFIDICCFDNYIWLIPDMAEHMIKINLNDESLETVDIQIENCCFHDSSKFWSAIKTEDELILLTNRANMIIRIKAGTHEISGTKLEIEEELFWKYHGTDFQNYIVDSSEGEDYILTDEHSTIQIFVDLLEQGIDEYAEERKERFRSIFKNADGSCGHRIWEYTRKELVSGLDIQVQNN